VALLGLVNQFIKSNKEPNSWQQARDILTIINKYPIFSLGGSSSSSSSSRTGRGLPSISRPCLSLLLPSSKDIETGPCMSEIYTTCEQEEAASTPGNKTQMLGSSSGLDRRDARNL
jgi:hypothetical protein